MNASDLDFSGKDLSRHLAMGQALLAGGHYAEAKQQADRILSQNPDCAEAWHLLGLCRHAGGDPEAALEALARADSLASGPLDITVDHASLLRELGRPAQALELLEQRLASRPDRPSELVVARAQSLCRLNRGSEAIAELAQLATLLRRDPGFWLLLAECREQNADWPGAMAALDKALDLSPVQASLIHRRRTRILMREQRVEEAESEIARAATEPGTVTAEEAARVRLVRADLAAFRGDFTRAAAEARSALQLDPGLYLAWLHVVPGRSKVPPRELLQTLSALCREKADDPYAWPLFVASGRALEAAGEHAAAFRLYTAANLKRSYLAPYDPEGHRRYTAGIIENLDRQFLDRVPRMRRETGTTRPLFIIGLPRSGTTLLESILATRAGVQAGGEMSIIHDWLNQRFGDRPLVETGALIGGLGNADITALAESWVEAVNRAGKGAHWLIDKLPDNYVFAGLCHLCFPEAPIIWMQRDPLDVGISCYTTPFMNGQEHSNRLEWLAHYHRLYQRLMAHWERVLPPGRLIKVDYEALVRDPLATTRALFARLGLPWDPGCLDFHRQERPVATASLQQVREPINTESIGRWRSFELQLQPLIAALSDPRDPLEPAG